MKAFVACIILCCAFLSGCYYDTKENLYPSLQTCSDTTNVTYTSKIAPILSSYCTSCHTVSTPNGNVQLETYAGVKAVVNNGKLMGSIKHDGSAIPMPQSGGKLDDCKIAVFTKWVNAGAPNN